MRAGKPVARPPLEPVHPPIAPSPAEIPERFIMPPDKHHLSHIPPKQHIMMPPPPLQHVPHEHYNQPHEEIRASPAEMSMASPPPRSLWDYYSGLFKLWYPRTISINPNNRLTIIQNINQ
ncbi:hypothetical protein lerEdw1_000587 [Lerista edwardsae]|nr:hypothetical protein lerEdw1_000587 [Lerista edwardsae]